jgi:hypothetical protein
MFDSMLLLQRGGHTVYFGPLGPSSSTLTNYLARHGADAIEPHDNPADYMLREIATPPSEKLSWKDAWTASPEYNSTVSGLSSSSLSPAQLRPVTRVNSEYPGFWYQVCVS